MHSLVLNNVKIDIAVMLNTCFLQWDKVLILFVVVAESLDIQ